MPYPRTHERTRSTGGCWRPAARARPSAPGPAAAGGAAEEAWIGPPAGQPCRQAPAARPPAPAARAFSEPAAAGAPARPAVPPSALQHGARPGEAALQPIGGTVGPCAPSPCILQWDELSRAAQHTRVRKDGGMSHTSCAWRPAGGFATQAAPAIGVIGAVSRPSAP